MLETNLGTTSIEIGLMVTSLILNTGLLGMMWRMNIQWYTVRERSDILWMQYCEEHNIPFRPVNKDFELRSK